MRDVFDVLADPTRRAILDELRRRGGCVVGELTTALGLGQPTVSKHLRVLRDLHVVDVVAESQQRRYSLRPGGLAAVEDWLAPHRAYWTERFEALGEYLDETDPAGGDTA
ncbi:Transcriptional regulator, ArsR family [Pseudonocardia sp. Ae168_Ps1]|nr:Transcriptional regulator, ArsR family [Pseudonocardia sp. Ae150A_Ps1]OLL80199.1 Transcriptional regulator, ArsR family [Pseudonocardia sp. Ae168_Ps1]OLL85673.1 Transcriptional regulator, ArsR family [Pseudonocardia sp. Ae263_Ps1]OLL94297.1 Transcriptional regulator, ArsR family [Pseudonocardia sp. Ae356_Ps1]